MFYLFIFRNPKAYLLVIKSGILVVSVRCHIDGEQRRAARFGST